MINRKYQTIVFAFFMSFFMSCLMSLVISILNMGFVSNIIEIWLEAWGFAFLVAFPAIILVAPVVRKLVELTVVDEPEKTREEN